MELDLSNIAYLLVDINSFKRVQYFRRNGPLKSVSIPIREFRFLQSNNFSMNILKLVTMDGKTILPEEALLNKEEQVEEKHEEPAVIHPLDLPEQIVEPVHAPQVQATPEKVKIDLLSTINEEEENIHVRLLSLEEYASYTKNELLVFLVAISPSLPQEVQERIEKENLSKEKVMKIIQEFVL